MDIANSHGNSRSTDAKSLLDTRLADLQDTVRRRQKGWAAALAAASDSEGDLAQVIRRERAARIALEQQLAERKARYEIDIARADAVRAMIDEQIREAALAVERAQQAEAAAVARVNRLRLSEADAVARLAEREDQFATELSTITATYDALEQQLSAAESALDSARHRVALAVAEVERLTRRELELTSQSVAEAAVRASLEHRVADVEAALLASSEQLSRERTHAAERLAADQARLEQEISTRRSVEEALDSARSTHADAERRHESAMAAAAAVLAERETELTALLAEAAAIRSALERRAVDAECTLADEQQRHRTAMATAATQLAAREEQFATELSTITASHDSLEQELHAVEARLTQETESRTALEQAITELRAAAAAAEQNFRDEIGAITKNARTERARQDDQMSRERHEYQIQLADEQQQHRTAMATAAARLAEREAQFETELSAIAATHAGLEEQLRDVEARFTQETESRTALEQAITELRAAAAAAEHNFRDEIATITENASAERARLEDEMSRERHSHRSQLADEQQQHRTAMATAATQLAAREEQFQTKLASIAGTRDSLEQQLHDVEARLTQESESRTALEQAITELRAAAAAAELDFREEIGTITGSARAERARLEDQMSHERREHQVRLADEQQQHRTLMANAATQLAAREAQFETELASIAGTRDRLEQQLHDVEARLTQETESRTSVEQAITELRAAAAAAERGFREEIGTLTENARTERARLEGVIAHQRAVAADRLAAREAEFAAELKRLSKDHATALATLQASAAERDSRLARATATLRSQLDASEAENLRQFEQTPVPLIRCTQDGALTGVNQAFAVLVGCRAPGELRDKDFAATRFESRDDLAWLIERSMNTGKTESLETTCVTKDGTRIAVRLSARPSASGLAECAVEDLTAVRVLEERLREAHRMESVGRLAREVAATCEKQLRDVYRDAQRLLMMTGAEAPQYSRTLLDEVTRVGGSLRQLVTYGHEQAAAQAPVDVNRILGDLESVLKQVAGDVVTLELRKGSSPVHVDVKAERVERLLVNVASYGRERMPHGGRLRIELSTVVVDGKFIAQYPNVRQGPHALITVIEVPRPATEGVESDQVGKPEARSSAVRPGVDLGALQELIAECGGHLWITAEPGGSMVVKMRLPLRAVWMGQADGQARHRLGRVTARLFGR